MDSCKRCGDCCTHLVTLLDSDIKRLLKSGVRKEVFKEVTEPTFGIKYVTFRHRKGYCIMYKDGLCSVHDYKPFVCRTGTCSQTMADTASLVIEMRKICPDWIEGMMNPHICNNADLIT